MRCHCGVVRVGLWLSLAIGSQAVATPILPGFDHLKAQPGTVWDFSSHEIDGGFFGPGSDPFEGQVAIYTDTLAWRTVGTDFPGGSAVIPTEMVAMSLHSVAPVRVTYDSGLIESFFDVFITIEPSRPSLGEYSLTHNAVGQPDGGSVNVDSFFDVFFDIEFKPAEFSPPPDGNMEPRHLYRQQLLRLAGPVLWSHLAPPAFSHPDSGGFFPGFDPAVQPPPDDSVPAPMTYLGSEFTWVVQLAPLEAVPEPATMLLLGAGLLALARRRRK